MAEAGGATGPRIGYSWIARVPLRDGADLENGAPGVLVWTVHLQLSFSLRAAAIFSNRLDASPTQCRHSWKTATANITGKQARRLPANKAATETRTHKTHWIGAAEPAKLGRLCALCRVGAFLRRVCLCVCAVISVGR